MCLRNSPSVPTLLHFLRAPYALGSREVMINADAMDVGLLHRDEGRIAL